MTFHELRCDFCDKIFVTESRYIKHKCRAMKRAEEFKTLTGQAAWAYYKKWMQSNKRSVQNSDVFLKSRFYGTFIKFAEFVKKVHIVDTNVFMRLMTERKYPPDMWTSDGVYVEYIEYMNYRVPPLDSVDISVNTILNLSDGLGIQPSQIFEELTPLDVIPLLRNCHLSPWLLLRSPSFVRLLQHKSSTEERMVMESIIRFSYWKQQFTTHKETLKEIDAIVQALQL